MTDPQQQRVLRPASERAQPCSELESPSVAGGVRFTLRAEGLMLLAVAVTLYVRGGYSGPLFAALFLVPDLSFLGYLAGPRAGALAYNTAHSSIGPFGLAIMATVALPAAGPYALIWMAHIGVDRTLGYGLKYTAGFGYTHLGRVGSAARRG